MAKPFGRVACCQHSGERWLGMSQEARACFGKADTARCPREQCNADTGLERAHRLAHGGRRDAEIIGRLAKAPALGDTQKGLNALKGAAIDCVVSLHGSCTLRSVIALSERRYMGSRPKRTLKS